MESSFLPWVAAKQPACVARQTFCGSSAEICACGTSELGGSWAACSLLGPAGTRRVGTNQHPEVRKDAGAVAVNNSSTIASISGSDMHRRCFELGLCRVGRDWRVTRALLVQLQLCRAMVQSGARSSKIRSRICGRMTKNHRPSGAREDGTAQETPSYRAAELITEPQI